MFKNITESLLNDYANCFCFKSLIRNVMSSKYYDFNLWCNLVLNINIATIKVIFLLRKHLGLNATQILYKAISSSAYWYVWSHLICVNSMFRWRVKLKCVKILFMSTNAERQKKEGNVGNVTAADFHFRPVRTDVWLAVNKTCIMLI